MSASNPHWEAGLEPFLEPQILGGPVAGEHHLLPLLVQRVEGMEDLLEHLLLVLEELDVVQQEQIGVAVTELEVVHPFAPDAVDEFVEEVLRGHVPDGRLGSDLADVVDDGVEEMGLAEAGAAVEEEGVEVFAGLLGYGLGGGQGQPVRLSDHEIVEDVLVEERGEGPGAAVRSVLLRLGLGGPSVQGLGGGDARGGGRGVLHQVSDLDRRAQRFGGEGLQQLPVMVPEPLHVEIRGDPHLEDIIGQFYAHPREPGCPPIGRYVRLELGYQPFLAPLRELCLCHFYPRARPPPSRISTALSTVVESKRGRGARPERPMELPGACPGSLLILLIALLWSRPCGS